MTTRKKRSRAKRNSKANRKSRQLSTRQQEERIRGLAAINLYRRGDAKSLSAAIAKGRFRGRIRVKASDPYSAKVQILADEGALTTTARGSRERELAGQHRATAIRVLRGLEPKSALERYRNRKVGGYELVSDYAQLVLLANAGVVGQLEPLYVSPDVAA